MCSLVSPDKVVRTLISRKDIADAIYSEKHDDFPFVAMYALETPEIAHQVTTIAPQINASMPIDQLSRMPVCTMNGARALVLSNEETTTDSYRAYVYPLVSTTEVVTMRKAHY
jgi:hypothetical protein